MIFRNGQYHTLRSNNPKDNWNSCVKNTAAKWHWKLNVSYDHHVTVTTTIRPLRSSTPCSYDQPPDFDFDCYDQLAHNFSIEYMDNYGMLAYQNYRIEYSYLLSTFDTRKGSCNRLSLTLSRIVFNHRSRRPPSWMIVTAADRNWWCTVWPLRPTKSTGFMVLVMFWELEFKKGLSCPITG